MYSKLFNDFDPFRSVIIQCFKDKLTPKECAIEIEKQGFLGINHVTDLVEGAPFLENLKAYVWDIIKISPDLKKNLDIFEFIDTAKISIGGIRSRIEFLKNTDPYFLSWLQKSDRKAIEKIINKKLP
jgi:hypothetical protein